MKTLTRTLLAANLTLFATTSAAGQAAEADRSLLAARDTIWHAWFANDTVLLRRFLPPAAASLEGATPRWSNRQQIAASSRDFVQGKSRLVDLKFAATQISRAGHSALVQSNYQAVVESGGRRDTTRGHATELFVLTGGTWVNPYWQLEPAGNMNDAGRAIPMPDTLGANFSIADSASSAGKLTDYDALVGTWEFRFQPRRDDGSFVPPFLGHWTFDKRPGGGLIEDHWRPDDPSEPAGVSLYTYRVFDPARKVWQMIGAGSRGGAIQPGLTWSSATDRFAIQRANGSITRIRYLSIDANHFLWRSDQSNDGGRTWLLDHGTMEATRIAK